MNGMRKTLNWGRIAAGFTLATAMLANPTPAFAGGSTQDTPSIGDLAPEIELEVLLQAPEGATATIQALRGKVIVIEFWATWCRPCVAAFPHLNELVEHFKGDDNFVFIAISDESQEKVEALLGKKPLNTWIGLDTDRSVFKRYAVNAIPRTIIIDRTGHIVADTYPAMVTTNALERIRDGKSHNIPNMSAMLGGQDGGQAGGPPAMPGMPTSIADINQMQLQGTVPGSEHQRLAALEGRWLVETSTAPAGPMGPTLTASAESTHKWIQGGRVLHVTEPIEGEGPLFKHSYFGFDSESKEYYLCQISPLESAPVLWSGTWDASHSRFEFSRMITIRMGGPGQDPADSAPGVEVEMTLTIEVTSDAEHKSTLSIDFSSMGMGGPGGKQVMRNSVAKRVK